MCDNGCHEEHADLKQVLDDLRVAFDDHLDKVHSKLLPPDQLWTKQEAVESDSRLEQKLVEQGADSKADRIEIHRQLDEMGDVVLGTRHVDFDGNITRTGGMKSLVDDNENGGIRFKWANLIIGALVTVIVGLMGLAGVVVAHQDDTQHIIDQVNQQIDNRLQTIINEIAQIEDTYPIGE